MWSDKIYDFLAKHWDVAVVIGVPAVCVLAFVLLQVAGVEVLGTASDYVGSIALFYTAIALVVWFLGLIAVVYDRVEQWRLRAMVRRQYRAELEAQARELEASCIRSRV